MKTAVPRYGLGADLEALLRNEVLAMPTADDIEQIAFNLSDEFGPDYVHDKREFALAVVDQFRSIIRARLSNQAMAPDGWRPIKEARKDRTPYLLLVRNDLAEFTGREDLQRWAGLRSSGIIRGWRMMVSISAGHSPRR